MDIIEFEEQYNEAVRKHIIEICCYECGFMELEKLFDQQNYGKYKKNGGQFYIVLDKNTIVATIGFLEVSKDVCSIEGFYIKKEYRGTGISKDLINKVISTATSKEFKRVELSTYESLERAIHFYKKIGFEITGKKGDDGLIMALNIK